MRNLTFLALSMGLTNLCAQVEITDANLCGNVMGNIWVTPDYYITVNNIDSVYLSVNQAPDGTGLNQNDVLSLMESINATEEGLYSFNVYDEFGSLYGVWNIESLLSYSANAGSSSTIDLCENTIVPLVGNEPMDQGQVASYYTVQWTQVDNNASVNWVTSANQQIAQVDGFSEAGTYYFEYTINPGSDCATSDTMTVTVEECFIGVEADDVEMCGAMGMNAWITPSEHITVSNIDSVYLYVLEAPTNSSLTGGTVMGLDETVDASEEGMYLFYIYDDMGNYYGEWSIENFGQYNANAGSSSSILLCEEDTVPLVGSLPYNNQNELAPYYSLEWTQIDTMPSVTWIGDADVQIASVTGFSEVGVYTFQYAYNPGTACESADIMTVTVEECDFSSVNNQNTVSVEVYPSLTDGLLNISLENTSTANINVLDLNGKVVFSGRITEGSNTLDVSELSSGLYIYHILVDGDMNSVGRFIKK